jgi:hypothetical protein
MEDEVITPGLAYTKETPAKAEDPAKVQVGGIKSGAGKIAGNVGITPSAELLKNMQDIIDRRTGGFNTFLGGLKDAVAITSRNPAQAMASRDEQKRLEEESTFKMRSDINTMKQAQEQAKRAREANLGLFGDVTGQGGTAPVAGGNAPVAGGNNGSQPLGQAGIGSLAGVPDNVIKQMAMAKKQGDVNGDYSGISAVYNKWLAEDLTEQTKRKYSFEGDVPRTMFTPDGKEELMSINEYQAKFGKKPTNADIKSATTAAAPASPQLRDAVQKGLFAQESSSGAADTSKPNAQGVQGPMQIKDTTFQMYQDQGIIPKNFRIDNPRQNKIAGDLISDHLFDKHNGNVDKVFAEYYGGPGAINKDGTINVNQRNPQRPNDPTVGQYIEQAKQKAGITPDMLAQSQPSAGGQQQTNKPLSYGEYKQQKKFEEEQQKENLDVGKEAHKKYLDSTSATNLSDRQVLNTRWEQWINKNSARSEKIVGIMNDPTLINAIGNILTTGVQTTQGNVGIAGLEEAFQKMQKGVGKEDVEALQEIKQILEARILDVIQRSKGSSSDKDMDAFRTIAGSSKNGIDLIYKLQQYDKAAIEADKEDRTLYNTVRKQNNGLIDFTDYDGNEARRAILAKKVEKANEIAKSQFVPRKAPVRPANVPAGAQYSPSTNSWWLNGKQVG